MEGLIEMRVSSGVRTFLIYTEKFGLFPIAHGRATAAMNHTDFIRTDGVTTGRVVVLRVAGN